MIIELKPAQQRILDQAAQTGMSADEALDQAFAVLDEQFQCSDWMEADKEKLAMQIEEGFRQAERGEMVDAEQAFRILQERRADRRIA